MNKISMDKQYTSNGKPVRLLCVDRPGPFPVVAIVGHSDLQVFSQTGNYWNNGDIDYRNLVEVKPKHDLWFNFYRLDFGHFEAASHDTKEDADNNARASRVACIRVPFTEGEGLSES